MNIKEILSTLKSIFALDSNVVHKTENETINGVKSFNNDIVLNGNLNLRNSVDNGFIRVQGGSDENKGSRLILSGKDRPNLEGTFELMATDGSVSSLLKGTKNGSLTWCNKNVDTIDSQGNGWIRYSNGIQICWGSSNSVSLGYEQYKESTVTYGNSFVANPKINLTANNPHLIVSFWNIGKTTFQSFIKCTSSGGISNAYSDYIAIGKWK